MTQQEQPTIKLRFDHTRLKLGAQFFELCFGSFHEFEVTREPVIIKGLDGATTISWSGKHVNELTKAPVDFLITEGYEHYGPKIYFEDEIFKHNGMTFTAR